MTDRWLDDSTFLSASRPQPRTYSTETNGPRLMVNEENRVNKYEKTFDG